MGCSRDGRPRSRGRATCPEPGRRDSPAGANPGAPAPAAGAARAALLPDVRNGDATRGRGRGREARRRDEGRARKARGEAGFSSTGAWGAPATRGRSRRGCSRSAHCKEPWRPRARRSATSSAPRPRSSRSSRARRRTRRASTCATSPARRSDGARGGAARAGPRGRLDAVGGRGRRGYRVYREGPGEPRRRLAEVPAAARPGPTKRPGRGWPTITRSRRSTRPATRARRRRR